MLYKLVPANRSMSDTQYIDGTNDAGVIAALTGKGMSIVGVPPKKVGDGQFKA